VKPEACISDLCYRLLDLTHRRPEHISPVNDAVMSALMTLDFGTRHALGKRCGNAIRHAICALRRGLAKIPADDWAACLPHLAELEINGEVNEQRETVLRAELFEVASQLQHVLVQEILAKRGKE